MHATGRRLVEQRRVALPKGPLAHDETRVSAARRLSNRATATMRAVAIEYDRASHCVTAFTSHPKLPNPLYQCQHMPVAVDDGKATNTRGKAPRERLQAVFHPLLAVFSSLASQERLPHATKKPVLILSYMYVHSLASSRWHR